LVRAAPAPSKLPGYFHRDCTVYTLNGGLVKPSMSIGSLALAFWRNSFLNKRKDSTKWVEKVVS
jgi:hypothetical protein